MPSIDEVAARAGVSTATVSRALRGRSGVSPETRDRVLAIADDMGYVASSSAAGLATGRNMAIGVLVPVVHRWFFASAIEGVDRQLRARGYDLDLYSLGGHGTNRERVFHRSMLRKRIDGLVVLCMALTDDELAALHALEQPVIVVGGPVEGCRHISIDDRAALRDATEHLIGLGHERIVHLAGGGSFGIDFSVPRLRAAGFEDAMTAAGLPVGPASTLFGDYEARTSKDVVARALAGDPAQRPTGVVASSDEMAFGALLAAAEAGLRVPEDVSVIGVDDHDFSEVFGLTTIRQDPIAAGERAAGLLLAALEKDAAVPIDQPATEPHELVVRRSTGRAPVLAGAAQGAGSGSGSGERAARGPIDRTGSRIPSRPVGAGLSRTRSRA
ncbi:LacI family DNA-binding transcriptional regulator [Tersicoccus sp. Bi-70]|uniref:LacI family DNA-binding transcriptional regulator n=1 Tax=Tersicoccus sp. Bi-70 TaxID=1897634 RepID=UPI000976D49E|nr:LacI family DNA-binding transcriptional regulator [Tersicoccus sp. Bi-70]OMH32319.1 LacI family transcriptional regulator [Tersicoccus sp. Bi-70]